MAKKKRVFEGQRLFTPNVVRRYTNSSGVLKGQTQDSLSGSQEPMSITGSFRYDPPGSPLKSTQQLPTDFTKWENHTFFCSAEANVNIIFDKIINRFPFDGKKKEYDDWMDILSIILDIFICICILHCICLICGCGAYNKKTNR